MSERTPTLEKFYLEKPWFDVMANDHLLLQTSTHPITFQSLEIAASRLGDRLLIAIDYRDAWREFTQRRPEFDMQANRNVCFEALNSYEAPSADAFEEVADRQNSPLTISVAAAARRAEASEHLDLIKKISQGKSTYPFWSSIHSQIRYVETQKLYDMTTDDLRIVALAVEELRRKQGLSKEEQRTELNAQCENLNATPQVQVINPTTGREYTSKELKTLGREDYRKILFFPNGQARPGAADRVTKILKGLV